MTDLVVRLNEFSSTWSQQMWQASWQGGLALMLVFAVSRAVRNMPVEMTCWLWRLAYLKFAVAALCVWSIAVTIPLPRAPERSAVNEMESSPASEFIDRPVAINAFRPRPVPRMETFAAPPGPRLSGMSWLMLAWAAGVFYLAGRLAMQYIAMRRFVSRLAPVADEQLLHDVAEAGRRMKVQHLPELRMTAEPTSPLLVGCIRPVIVLPTLLLEQSHADERAVAIAHELAHVKRQDLLWNWLPALTRIAFFFHPLVWLAQREWRLTQETATDKLAIASSRLPTDRYAALLLELVSKYTAATRIPPTAIAVSDVYSQLNRRILAMKTFQKLSTRRTLIMFLVVLLAAVFCLLPINISAQSSKFASPGETNPISNEREIAFNESIAGAGAADDEESDPWALAAKEFGPEYSLQKNEVVKRIAPPYTPGRQTFDRRTNTSTTYCVFAWSDHRIVKASAIAYKAPEMKGSVAGLLSTICGIGYERLRGDHQLLQGDIEGDFIVRQDAPREEIVKGMETILSESLESPIEIELGETDEDVYVGRGTFELSEVVKARKNVIVLDSRGVHKWGFIIDVNGSGGYFSASLEQPLSWKFDRFAWLVVSAVKTPVFFEVETPPKNVKFAVIQQNEDVNKFNVQRAIDSLSAQTGLTFTKEKRKILTLTVKAPVAEAPPPQEVSSTRTQANENSEPSFESRLASAIEQFGDEYALDENQVVKRIFPAQLVNRAGFFRILNNGKFKEIYDRPEFCVVLHWRDNDIPFSTQMTFGPEPGVSIRSLLPVLCRIGRERLRGDDELMAQIVPGDFVVMHNGPREEIVDELETIFNDAVKTPVELKLGETEEDVYVVRGTFELNDDVQARDSLVVIESLSDTYSRPVHPDFDGFVEIIVLATGVPVLSEVAKPPPKVKLVTKQQTAVRSQFDLQAALDCLTAQTGLTFTKERRKILTLTVAEKE